MAEDEAVVDPDMARGPLAPSVLNEERLSAEHKDGEHSQGMLPAAASLAHGPPQRPSGDCEEVEVNQAAVEPSAGMHIMPGRIGGQNGPSHSIGAATATLSYMRGLDVRQAKGESEAKKSATRKTVNRTITFEPRSTAALHWTDPRHWRENLKSWDSILDP